MNGFLSNKKGSLDMLNKENKVLFYFLIAVVLYSCGNRIKGKDYYAISINTIGINQYNLIKKQIDDSIKNWCNNRLLIAEELWRYDYKVDSVICFNTEKNKLKGAILIRCNKNICLQDDIRFLYGILINRKWYFATGPTVVLPREAYQKDIHIPLSFEKMHEIAIDEVFKGYLKSNGEINEGFFHSLKKNAGGYDFTTQEAWEASYLKLVGENWQKRDSTKQEVLP